MRPLPLPETIATGSRSKQSVLNCLAAVTVLMPICMLADAWATALLVLGENEGATLAREKGIDVLFVLRKGSR